MFVVATKRQDAGRLLLLVLLFCIARGVAFRLSLCDSLSTLLFIGLAPLRALGSPVSLR
jgi:hypothetical protein